MSISSAPEKLPPIIQIQHPDSAARGSPQKSGRARTVDAACALPEKTRIRENEECEII